MTARLGIGDTPALRLRLSKGKAAKRSDLSHDRSGCNARERMIEQGCTT
jgi:hypothetical protein